MKQISNFLSSPTFIIVFIIFLILSYFLIKLLTGSYLKPLKYLGIPCLITGIFTISLKWVINLIKEYLTQNNLGILNTVMETFKDIFVKFGLIFIAIGLLSLIIYFILNKVLNNKKNELNT